MMRSMLDNLLRAVCVALLVAIAGLGPSAVAHAGLPPGYDTRFDIWPTAVDKAQCRPGDRVETGLQGEVPVADRESHRSAQGYNCNIDLVGQHQGTGAGITSTSYKDCTYVGSTWPYTNGVQVIDASDPAHPVQADLLTEPAMVGGTWESLKVHAGRGLLVGTGVPLLFGGGYISIYDISQDCRHPRLLNEGAGSLPGVRIPMLTHEGNFSPDGNTYWAGGIIWNSAVDITDPTAPHVVWSAPVGWASHGMGFAPDGRTMYMSQFSGLTVLDTSAVQDRVAPDFTMHQLLPAHSHKAWVDGQEAQHSVYVTYRGVPHIFTIDELGSGGVKLFDVSDPTDLKLRNIIKLEINLPEHMDNWTSSGGFNGVFAYDSHYCSVDRQDDPTALACGWIQSGIRVFDVRNPEHITELAYFNPPAQSDKKYEDLPNSIHVYNLSVLATPPLTGIFGVGRAALDGKIQLSDIVLGNRPGWGQPADFSADWCMSPPEFRGNLLYVTCSDNGFMTLKLDPTVYPPR
ncbi:hypothetical protein B7435_28920 [Mycolicibacterium peregrinum]|nr:hypothetical protein B7435_28920 [Mycolicibacterium peregrinum]